MDKLMKTQRLDCSKALTNEQQTTMSRNESENFLAVKENKGRLEGQKFSFSKHHLDESCCERIDDEDAETGVFKGK